MGPIRPKSEFLLAQGALLLFDLRTQLAPGASWSAKRPVGSLFRGPVYGYLTWGSCLLHGTPLTLDLGSHGLQKDPLVLDLGSHLASGGLWYLMELICS